MPPATITKADDYKRVCMWFFAGKNKTLLMMYSSMPRDNEFFFHIVEHFYISYSAPQLLLYKRICYL